jgi:hypothetical protein
MLSLVNSLKNKIMATQIAVLIVIALLLTYIGIRVSAIRTRSRYIIPNTNTTYHFDIVDGPGVFSVFGLNKLSGWDERLRGFELLISSEPCRDMAYCSDKKIKDRRCFSYLLVPHSIYEYSDYKTGKKFYPNLGDDKKHEQEIEKFLSEKNSVLKMTGVIYKERRGYIHSAFVGGPYGTRYDFEIIYNVTTSTGRVTIEEK